MFSRATLTLSGSTAQTSTLTIATNVAALSLPPRPDAHRNELFFALAMLPLPGLICRTNLRKLLLVIAMLGVISLGITGCGNSGPAASTTTTPGTYSISVTATLTSASGTTTQAQTLTVVVQ